MNVVNPKLNKLGHVCNRGGPGRTQVANIKMSDPSQQCPNKTGILTMLMQRQAKQKGTSLRVVQLGKWVGGGRSDR